MIKLKPLWSAQPGVDYTTSSGTLSFLPNTTTASIIVSGLDDNGTGESKESFRVSLSNPTNATLGTANMAESKKGNIHDF